jgi:hypothetical protein
MQASTPGQSQSRVPKRRAPSGKSVADSAGAANRRFAVAATNWESVGGAGMLAPGWTPAGANLDHQRSDLGWSRDCSCHSNRLPRSPDITEITHPRCSSPATPVVGFSRTFEKADQLVFVPA